MDEGFVDYKVDNLTIRDYFAAHAPEELCRVEKSLDAEKLIGQKQPNYDDVAAMVVWNARVEAFLRFAYADAMLKAGANIHSEDNGKQL